MSNARIVNGRYTVGSLYQWDINQELKIYGLTLAKIPEIHFTSDAMLRAIVQQSTMNASGVITTDIPNSLLQKPYKIKAHVCIYDGNTFETVCTIEIPVIARKQPADYTISDNDGEIYSFNELSNKIDNTLVDATNRLNQAEETYKNVEQLISNGVDTAVNDAFAGIIDETLTFEDRAAEAKATGDAINAINGDIDTLTEAVNDLITDYTNLATVYTGRDEPTASIGVDGDVYIKTEGSDS